MLHIIHIDKILLYIYIHIYRYNSSWSSPCIIIIKSPNKVWRFSVFAPFLLLIIIIIIYYYYYYYYYYSSSSSRRELDRPNSQTDDPIFTKLHRKVDPHLKRCHQILEFWKWPPLPWKPWTYVKIFDLTYIGNCQRVSTRLGVYIK